MDLSSIIHSDPDIQGGVPVFVGTRVPVKNLFDYLEAGDTVDDFLKSFPSVSREQVIAALHFARDALATGDPAVINANAAALNAEAEDALSYQRPL